MTGFEYPGSQNTYEGLERWMKERRDEWTGLNYKGREWRAIDTLLDEVREAGVEGYLPWQR
jgi:hypothetical protein